jgi:hypothetical protein
MRHKITNLWSLLSTVSANYNCFFAKLNPTQIDCITQIPLGNYPCTYTGLMFFFLLNKICFHNFRHFCNWIAMYSCSPLIRPPILKWKSGHIRSVASLEWDNLIKPPILQWKNGHARRVTSIELDNLIVIY